MKLFGLEVWGDFACFTRPDMHVERYSYPVITPSAARGIFDSIYLHIDQLAPYLPTFRWQVRRIEIVNPVRFMPFSRNEVKGVVNVKRVLECFDNPNEFESLYADDTSKAARDTGRTQRQTILLRHVRYRLFAEPVLFRDDPALELQIAAIFNRRARKGQCHHQPFLGCREFSADFELVEAPGGECFPYSDDLGWMVYDVFDLSRPGSCFDSKSVSLFRARIQNGILDVPEYTSDEVRKPIRGDF